MCYQVKKCGVEFRWNMFGMTTKDSDMLAMGLKSAKKLRKIKIKNSQLDDDNFYDIYDGLRNINKLGNIVIGKISTECNYLYVFQRKCHSPIICCLMKAFPI